MQRINSISERPRALIALMLAGSTWGLTLPLSAVALRGVAPAALVSIRFGCAASILAVIARRGSLRAALTWRIAWWGVLGYGAVVLTQCEGVERTSLSHAAVLGGIVPVLVVLIAIARGCRRPSALGTLGLLGAVGGAGLFTSGGGHASLAGDALVLLAGVCFSFYIVAQPALLAGRDAVAVTAVQMGAASIVLAPIALFAEPAPHISGSIALALLGLVVVGSLLPFALYAWGQTRVPHELAGAFLNVEALVGGLIGVVAFHNQMGLAQVLAVALIAAGLLLVAASAPSTQGSGRDIPSC
ncbi:MAG TPA: DMT family transporter [Solirubrobacteraceae bacterium]|jgi:O-acetylserine/cysteine efflux transporter